MTAPKYLHRQDAAEDYGPAKWLICQGRCNPTIGAVDAALREACEAQIKRGDGRIHLSPLHEAIVAFRVLKHTPHYAMHRARASEFTCATCGSVRRYGARSWE